MAYPSENELTTEMIRLLGRELRVAKQKIEGLEAEQNKVSSTFLSLPQSLTRLIWQNSKGPDIKGEGVNQSCMSSGKVKNDSLDILKSLLTHLQEDDADIFLKKEDDDSAPSLDALDAQTHDTESTGNETKPNGRSETLNKKRAISSPLYKSEQARMSLESRLKEALFEKDAACKNNTNGRKEIQDLKAEIGHQSKDLLTERSAVASLKARLSQMQVESSARKKDNEALLRSVQEKDDLMRTCSGLKESLKNVTATNEDLLKTSNTDREEIDTLHSRISALKNKRNAQKTATLELHKTCEEQAKKIEDIEESLNKFRKANEDLQQDLQREAKKIEDIEGSLNKFRKANDDLQQDLQREKKSNALLNARKFYLSPSFKSFVDKMSVPEVRPQSRFLMPIGKSSLDLPLRISSDPVLRQYRGSCLRYKAMLWYKPCHVLVFAPSSHHEHTKGSVWSPSAEFTSLDGQVRELFYDEGGFIFYGGTFKCHATETWSKDGVLCPWDENVRTHNKNSASCAYLPIVTS
ncbi:hypothetical protein C0991_001268 [Blastosporella zonata]|nr:hypothetical protein C0991_001268 [Blastosporella zonata]